jgi:hypothetical protein
LAEKSQETKVKKKVTGKAFDFLRLFMHKNEDKKTSTNGPRSSFQAPILSWAAENAKTQIQNFEKKGSQANSITQCENRSFS